MRSRALGNGKLERVPNYAGTQIVWRARWTDAGGKRRCRILSTDRRVAERAFARLVRERDLQSLGLGDEEGQNRVLREVCEAYLPDHAVTVSPRQAKRVEGILTRLMDEIGDLRVRELRPEWVGIYRQRRLRQGTANRTVNLEIGTLKAMLNWALACGLIAKNPVAHVKPLPSGKAHEKRPRRALTRQEIDAFLVAAQTIDGCLRARREARKSIADGTRGRAYKAKPRRPYVPQASLWTALVWTGARFGELTAVCWGDVDLETATLTLPPPTTKNKKGRVIPLLPVVVDAMRPLREVHREVLGREPTAGDHVFLTPRGASVHGNYRRALTRFREVCREAGIANVDEQGRKVDIHALRHTFASELGRANVGLTHAQHLLGHSDPKLTASLYTHLGVEDLRGAVSLLQGAGHRAARARA
jgi:integrase